jgi:hypothetical protein
MIQAEPAFLSAAEALLLLAKQNSGTASALTRCEAAGKEALGWLVKLLLVGGG